MNMDTGQAIIISFVGQITLCATHGQQCFLNFLNGKFSDYSSNAKGKKYFCRPLKKTTDIYLSYLENVPTLTFQQGNQYI